MNHPLSALLAVPLAGLGVLFCLPSRWSRSWTLLIAALEAGIAGWLTFQFNPSAGIQFAEQAPWIPSLGAQYLLGADGMGLAFTVLSALIFLLALAANAPAGRAYYAWFLALLPATFGTFLSLDLLLFFFCFEFTLIPMYFLIAGWGGERRQAAATKFLLYTVLGSVILLIGILALHHAHFAATGVRTFSQPLLAASPLAPALQTWLFWAFLAGFAVKVPMIPFHTWLPEAHTEASTAGSMVLAAVLLKMGTYGLLRFSLPLFPDAARAAAPALAVLSILAIVYGALVSLAQKDWKRLVAYSSISHMGFCTLGIFAFTENALAGSLLQQINHGLSSALLFFLAGAAHDRTHTREIAAYGGHSRTMPRFAVVFLLAVASSMGIPPLNGFVGEVTLLTGVYAARPAWAAWGVFGVLLGAAYLLWLYQRTMLGEPRGERLADLSLRELAITLPLVAGIVWIGLQPAPLLSWFTQPVSAILSSR